MEPCFLGNISSRPLSAAWPGSWHWWGDRDTRSLSPWAQLVMYLLYWLGNVTFLSACLDYPLQNESNVFFLLCWAIWWGLKKKIHPCMFNSRHLTGTQCVILISPAFKIGSGSEASPACLLAAKWHPWVCLSPNPSENYKKTTRRLLSTAQVMLATAPDSIIAWRHYLFDMTVFPPMCTHVHMHTPCAVETITQRSKSGRGQHPEACSFWKHLS